MQDHTWARLPAYVMGLVNGRLLLQCEYLIADNRILRSHVSGKLRLWDPERCTLAEIGKRFGRKYLAEVAYVAKPETILTWYRRLIARKFDGPSNAPTRKVLASMLQSKHSASAWRRKRWLGYDRISGGHRAAWRVSQP